MFFAPKSRVVTPGATHLIQRTADQSTTPKLAVVLLIFCVVQPLHLTHASAQQTALRFEDLAAQAAAAREQQNIPRAIDLYNQAEKLRPDWAEGWFYLGVLQYSDNQFEPAIDAFNHLLELQPTAAPAMALRGLCEFETAAYDNALRDLETAVNHGAANEPRNEQIIRYHLAQLLTRASRFQEATAQYKIFAAQHVIDSDLLVGLGLSGMHVPLLVKDVEPADRTLYESAGKAGYEFLAGNSDRARIMFDELFTQYPAAPNLHLFYGYLLFVHDPNLAIQQFEKEVSLSPNNFEAHAILGYTYMIAGRYSEAVPESEKALAGAPGMETAVLALGRSLAETGDVKRGTDLLKQALRDDPDNLEAHMGLAAIYSRAGQREDAYHEHMLCLSLAK